MKITLPPRRLEREREKQRGTYKLAAARELHLTFREISARRRALYSLRRQLSRQRL
jgi:hypothetical protein